MSEDVSTGQPAAVLEQILDGASTVTVTCTTARLLFAAVAALDDLPEDARPSETRLLTTPGAAKRAKRDFLTATTLADLRASDGVELRTTDEPSLPEPAVVTENAVFPVLSGVLCRTSAIRVTDEAFHEQYLAGTDQRWEDAATYDLHTFRRSQFLDSLEGKFGGAFREDFERALAAPGARSDDDGVDPVDLLVLMAAKHSEQSYELNRWGESFGVASVGKFSQSKRRLEEIGLVETEKVRSDSVGRPRQRLVVGKEELADASPEELVAAMRTVSG